MTAAGHMRSRRSLLGGSAAPMRPPWAVADFAVACSRCGECVPACPAGVLGRDPDGTPVFIGGNEGCTFCRACVESCKTGALDPGLGSPWSVHAVLQDARCLASMGVHCQSCADACEASAIRFRPRLGGPPVPALDDAACTGCSACTTACPADALTLHDPRGEAAA